MVVDADDLEIGGNGSRGGNLGDIARGGVFVVDESEEPASARSVGHTLLDTACKSVSVIEDELVVGK